MALRRDFDLDSVDVSGRADISRREPKWPGRVKAVRVGREPQRAQFREVFEVKAVDYCAGCACMD